MTNRKSGTTSRKVGTSAEPAVTTARKLEPAGDEISANQSCGKATDESLQTSVSQQPARYPSQDEQMPRIQCAILAEGFDRSPLTTRVR